MRKTALITVGVYALLFLFICIALGLPKWYKVNDYTYGGLFKQCVEFAGKKECSKLEGPGGTMSKIRATAAMMFFAMFGDIAGIAFSAANTFGISQIDPAKLWLASVASSVWCAATTFLAVVIFGSVKLNDGAKYGPCFALAIVSLLAFIGTAAWSFWSMRKERGGGSGSSADSSYSYQAGS